MYTPSVTLWFTANDFYIAYARMLHIRSFGKWSRHVDVARIPNTRRVWVPDWFDLEPIKHRHELRRARRCVHQ